MGLEKPITDYESVATWAEGLRKQWGGDPLAEEPEKIEALRTFCDFVGEDPDHVVKRCFFIRKADGERVLSDKWRKHYAEKIRDFRAQAPASEGRRRASAVLGFMIHNGVLIQA